MDNQNNESINKKIEELITSFKDLNKNVQILTNVLKENYSNKKNNIKYNNDKKSINRPTERNIINSQQCKGKTPKGDDCKLLTRNESGFCRFHKF